MENPDTWGPAQRVVQAAIAEYEDARRNWTIGLSLPTRIVNALRDAGLLKEN